MDEGFSVQLKHNDKETSWEDHGFVKISQGEQLLAESAGYQHNPFSRSAADRTKELMTAFKAKLPKVSQEEAAPASEEAEKIMPAHSDSESSTTVPSDDRA